MTFLLNHTAMIIQRYLFMPFIIYCVIKVRKATKLNYLKHFAPLESFWVYFLIFIWFYFIFLIWLTSRLIYKNNWIKTQYSKTLTTNLKIYNKKSCHLQNNYLEVIVSSNYVLFSSLISRATLQGSYSLWR